MDQFVEKDLLLCFGTVSTPEPLGTSLQTTANMNLLNYSEILNKNVMIGRAVVA